MSKWVETAMRPVPERSHILKTWPTKAGPLAALPLELKLEILTVDGKAEEVPESADWTALLAEDFELEIESEESKCKECIGIGRTKGTQILEVVREEEEEEDDVVLGVKMERRLDVADWRKWDMGSVGEAMGFGILGVCLSMTLVYCVLFFLQSGFGFFFFFPRALGGAVATSKASGSVPVVRV